MIAWSMVDVLWAFLYAVGCIITMFSLSWKLALISLCVLPPLAIVSIRLQKKMLKHQREARKQNSRITARSTKHYGRDDDKDARARGTKR